MVQHSVFTSDPEKLHLIQSSSDHHRRCSKKANRNATNRKGFILSLPRPDPCGSEQPIHRERPVATQHPLRNCVDHLAAPSHIYAPPRVETGQ